MGRRIRNHLKEHGAAATRKRFGKNYDCPDIMFQGKKVGSVSREWHRVYCTWTWKGVVTYEGNVYSHLSVTSAQECVQWGERKMKCLLNPEFGTALKELIDLSGFTQVQVAEEIGKGCSRDVIQKWIKGHSHPGVHILVRLCKLLAVLEWEPLYTELSEIIELER